MSKLGVTLPTGERVDAEIVRYFDAYGKKYLVYTLNEKDEQGFVKLYVAKLNGTPKALVGEFIEDDNEWSVLKGEFKKIIGENSDAGRTTANDMNPIELENVNVRGHRIIKLMESYVNLLGANKKSFEVEPNPMSAPTDFPGFPEAPAFQTSPAQTPFVAPVQGFPEPQPYQAPSAPVFPEMPTYQAPEPPKPTPQPDFGMPMGVNPMYPGAPSYNQPVQPTPVTEPKTFSAPLPEFSAPTSSTNYEEMYNDVKAKLERCTAELEKVTNENIELRIKIDDIREILNGN